MEEKVNILYQASDFYAPMAGISILSLLENNKHLKEICIYILTDDISEENKEKLNSIIKKFHREVRYINAKQADKLLEKEGVSKHNGSYAPFYKLFINEFVSEGGDKLIYIDADTLVLGSIQGLLEFELGDKPYAIVKVPMYREYYEMIGITKQSDCYPNTGVMVFSRKNWKKNKCIERLLKYLKESKSNAFRAADQDIISIVFDETIGILPPEYNVGASWYFLGIEKFKRIHDATEENFYTDLELKKAMDSPIICHCLGGMYGRPWEEGNFSPFKELWMKYKEKSPWKNQNLIPRTITKMDKCQWLFFKLAPSYIYIRVHRYFMKKQCERQFQR